MTITYQVEQLQHDDGEDLFLVKSATDTRVDDEVIELEVLDDLMTLRASDLEAYEWVVTAVGLFLARGPELERAEA
jgi:hypothetical protein